MVKKNTIKLFKTAMIYMVVVALASGAAFGAVIPADVAESAHSEAIEALFDAGVAQGSDDGLFHPYANLTRAQACAMIVRAISPPTAELAGTPTQTLPGSGFPDMGGYSWSDRYVSFAVRHGIVNGYPDGTFKPGANVSSAEMLTMILRAAGHINDETGFNWPADYIALAIFEGITAGLSGELPNLATREIAALMIYNKLEALREIGEEMEEAVKTEEDEPESNVSAAWVRNLEFVSGIFNSDMTSFAGMPVSRDVVVYTYGTRGSFRRGMALPRNEGDFRRDTIHKFRSAETPAFYIKTGDEITLMVLPMDAGFSGRVYGVINGFSVTNNGRGDVVNSIHTLAAGRQVSWLTANASINAPATAVYREGEVYEFIVRNGIITSGPRDAADTERHANFRELAPTGDPGNPWSTVEEVLNDIVTLEDGSKFTVASDAAIYVLNTDGESYRAGRHSDFREGSQIRLFRVLNMGDVAHIITVRN